MEPANIARTKEDVLAHIKEGYCLVVQKDNAFLVEGMFSHGFDRKNVLVLKEAADDAVNLAALRELKDKEIRQRCRPLHRLKGEQVFA